MERSLKGYNLAEVILAVGLAVVVVLALLGVGLSATRSNRKATDSVAGQLVADMVLENALHAAAKDAADPLWAADSGTAPVTTGSVQVGSTTFDYRTFARNVPVGADAGSSPPPGAPTLMKKVDVEVSWWNSDQAARAGYGNLKAYATRTIQVP